MDSSVSRRVRVLSGQIAASAPSANTHEVELARLPTASSSSGTSSSYASATGQPSSYARVHGEVSRAPARWRAVPRVGKETLEDVKYEKAEGEGIAKVRMMLESIGLHGYEAGC